MNVRDKDRQSPNEPARLLLEECVGSRSFPPLYWQRCTRRRAFNLNTPTSRFPSPKAMTDGWVHLECAVAPSEARRRGAKKQLHEPLISRSSHARVTLLCRVFRSYSVVFDLAWCPPCFADLPELILRRLRPFSVFRSFRGLEPQG